MQKGTAYSVKVQHVYVQKKVLPTLSMYVCAKKGTAYSVKVQHICTKRVLPTLSMFKKRYCPLCFLLFYFFLFSFFSFLFSTIAHSVKAQHVCTKKVLPTLSMYAAHSVFFSFFSFFNFFIFHYCPLCKGSACMYKKGTAHSEHVCCPLCFFFLFFLFFSFLFSTIAHSAKAQHVCTKKVLPTLSMYAAHSVFFSFFFFFFFFFLFFSFLFSTIAHSAKAQPMLRSVSRMILFCSRNSCSEIIRSSIRFCRKRSC